MAALTGCQGSDANPSAASAAPSATTNAVRASTPAASTPSVTAARAADLAIRAVVQQDWKIWIECSAAPADCDAAKRLALVRTTTGSSYRIDLTTLREWAAKRYVVRQPRGRPDQNFINTESVTLGAGGTTASALTCLGDGRVLYRPASGGRLVPVGKPYSEAQGYNRTVYHLVLLDGAWKIDRTELVQESLLPEGKVLCTRAGS